MEPESTLNATEGRVLLVDDDEMISVALYEYLGRLGIGVDRAVEPDAAMEAMRGTLYAVVVVDAYLTGHLHRRPFELIEMLRASQPKARLVVLTAYGSAGLLELIRAGGAITVIDKPQSISTMAEVVTGLLAAAASERSNAHSVVLP